jgi:nucleoside permease NupC
MIGMISKKNAVTAASEPCCANHALYFQRILDSAALFGGVAHCKKANFLESKSRVQEVMMGRGKVIVMTKKKMMMMKENKITWVACHSCQATIFAVQVFYLSGP